MIPSTDNLVRLPRRDLDAARDVDTIARLRALVGVTRLVRSGDDLSILLEQIARVVSEALGFRTVVINLYRQAWDDFEVTTVHGSGQAAAALLGTTQGWDVWAPLLDARFDRGGAFFVPAGEYDWSEDGVHSYVPPIAAVGGGDAWQPEDALFVPLADAHGNVLGILSVDEPATGLRPPDEEVDVLVAVAQHAAAAVENAQEAASQAQHRAALEQLAFVSSHLTATLPVDAILQSICDGVRSALGFRRVTIELLDRTTGHFHPRAAAGWRLDDDAVNVSTTPGEFLSLCEPQFELEGCYLLSPEDAFRRVSAEHRTYSSELNGRGPHAWNHHWLVVPLKNTHGEMTGFIWADDPQDRLLPSRERLQALRMFANQTQTALDFAEQFDAVRAAGEAQRAIVQASPLAILDLEFPDGIVRAWNPAAERIFGWTEAEVLGRRLPIVPPGHEEEFDVLTERLASGETLYNERLTRQRKDGTLVEVVCSATPLRDGDGRVRHVVALHTEATR